MHSQNRIERQLEEVLRSPGNDKCADCHASAPRWASVNLGIFICVHCAAEHRKMGTHRSRVKSVTLDEWTREQVATMRQMGNIRSNAIYNPDEARHPPPPATSVDERDSELAKYIRRKYELGAFKREAPKDLASSNAITSRALARDARSGHENRAPLRPDELPRRDRDLPALPPTAGRRRATPNTQLWSGLAPQGTGASSTSNGSTGSIGGSQGSVSQGSGSQGSGSQGSYARPNTTLPPRTSSSPAFSASSAGTSTAAALLKPAPFEQQRAANLNVLVDVEGSSSSTRPLQLNGFPTIPAFPATPAGPHMMSPGGVISPLALGQQAFVGNSSNPFFAMAPQVTTPPHANGGGYFSHMPQQQSMGPVGSMNMGMGNVSMNGMGMGMGHNMNNMGMNGMSNLGVGMPGAMGGGMSMGTMGVPVQVQASYQQHPWGSYAA